MAFISLFVENFQYAIMNENPIVFPLEPTGPVNMTIIGVTNSSITLQILPVPIMEQNGLIINYTFTCYKFDSTYNFTFAMEMETTTLLIENMTVVEPLEVYTIYNISVYPSTVVGPGPEVSVEQRTSEGSE